MFCPFRNDECYIGCALWSQRFEECAILTLGEGMADVAIRAEDEGIKVVQDDD